MTDPDRCSRAAPAPEEQALPADEKNIRVYLHFDKQRKSIDGAESDAADTAYTIATTRCTKQQP